MALQRKQNARLPPEVNRILYIRNLPYKITSDEMYDIFGKYGAIRQIRMGETAETRGTAFVVYEDIFDAKNACDHLSGFNVCNRYLVVLYYQANKAYKRMETDQQRTELEKVKDRFGLGGEVPKTPRSERDILRTPKFNTPTPTPKYNTPKYSTPTPTPKR